MTRTLLILLATLCLAPIAPAADAWAGAQQAYLKASNTGQLDLFGTAVAASGDTVVVGADGEDSAATGVDGDESDDSAPGAGAVYVFVRDGTGWSQQAYLKASNTDAGDAFGRAVAIDGDTLVVGARDEDGADTGVDGNEADDSAPDAGAVYVFVRDGTSWSQQAYLKASNTQGTDRFGSVVAISGDTIAVGAIGENSAATGIDGDEDDDTAADAGAVYVFVRGGSTWSQQAYVKASNTDAGDGFGTSLSLSGDTLVVGAAGEDGAATGVDGNEADDSAAGAGAAYVFTRSGSSWSQQAYVKASNTDAGDAFGQSVAVDGDTLLVGASLEASDATGVDGNEADDSAAGAGAAYVFTRSGSSWSQQAYVKASNTDAGDGFGGTVALSGETAAVAAAGEDGAAMGVGGDDTSDGAPGAGAVCVFGRDGASWSQQAYVKASNTDPGDLFGRCALSGDTLVVGASQEASAATGVGGDEDDDSAFFSGAAYVLGVEPWQDLGLALAGTGGEPVLEGSGPLLAGFPVALGTSGARANAAGTLFIGLSTLLAPLKGGTLVPSNDLLVTGLVTDGAGALTLATNWPAGVPSCTTIVFQLWIADPAGPQGFAATNGLSGTTP